MAKDLINGIVLRGPISGDVPKDVLTEREQAEVHQWKNMLTTAEHEQLRDLHSRMNISSRLFHSFLLDQFYVSSQRYDHACGQFEYVDK